MKKSVLKEELFFSMTWDYLNVFLPSQHQDSPETAKSLTSVPFAKAPDCYTCAEEPK